MNRNFYKCLLLGAFLNCICILGWAQPSHIDSLKPVNDSLTFSSELSSSQKKLLQDVKNNKQFAELDSNQKLEAKNKEVALLIEKNKVQELIMQRQKYGVIALAIGVSFFILLTIILFKLFRVKRKSNERLTEKNAEIEMQSAALTSAYQNLSLLSEIGKSITSRLSVEEIVEVVYKSIQSLMDTSAFGIGVLEDGKLNFHGAIEEGEKLNGITFSLEEEDRLAVHCYKHRKEILINDYEEQIKFFANKKLLPKTSNDSHSIIYVPLSNDKSDIGVMTVQSFQKNAYNDYHVYILRNLAVYASIALENAAIYKEMEEKKIELEEASQKIASQNEKLIGLNNDKNQLIGIVAHDLRNPIAAALGFTNFLSSELENLNMDQAKALKGTQRSLNRMNEMIGKILDLRAIESRKVKLDRSKINMTSLLAQVQDNFREQAENKNLRLHLSFSSKKLYVNTDWNYTAQVFENLVSNAVKFSQSERSITMQLREDDNGYVVASIKDEGPGIHPDEQHHLFKAFQKLSARPTAGEHSTGLGLAIVKKYVEAMGGKIWVESQLGKGSEFNVAFKKYED